MNIKMTQLELDNLARSLNELERQRTAGMMTLLEYLTAVVELHATSGLGLSPVVSGLVDPLTGLTYGEGYAYTKTEQFQALDAVYDGVRPAPKRILNLVTQ